MIFKWNLIFVTQFIEYQYFTLWGFHRPLTMDHFLS